MQNRKKSQVPDSWPRASGRRNAPSNGKMRKAANKVEGTTWPKFWSACNKRLKSASNWRA
jgi:hypothetical protein